MKRFFWLSILASCATALADDGGYKFEREIPIGGEGGWDILTIDAEARRLYLSHATKVIVADIDANKVVGEIADTPGVHAFMAVPEFQRGFSSNGKENKISVVDLKTLQTTAKLDSGENPDAMAYDAKRRELYVFNHSGNSATVVDTREAKVISTVPLGGSPEFGAADGETGRVFVNLEDKNEIAVIDANSHQVIARWPIAPGEEASGLALDATHHRLFTTCHNKMMEMIDAENGKVIGSVPVGDGVDGCVFDEAKQLAFASCGEGVTVIAREEAPDKISLVQSLATERGARTIALDPKTRRIFLPTAKFQPPPSPAPGASPARPTIVPDSQKLLVYGP